MKSQFLNLMKCPYCGSGFKIVAVIDQKEDELTTGWVKCECSEFPFLEGILILRANPLIGRVIDLVKNGRVEEAEILCLGWESFERVSECLVPFPFSTKISFALSSIISVLAHFEAKRKFGRLHRYYSDTNLPFYDALGKSLFETYLKHRFSSETFWSLYPFISLLKQKKQRILDLGCGAGHASFVISKYVKPEQLCCADYSFNLLYFAKKYFAQGAEFVCLDSNYPLPFKDKIFSTILMLDSFHYVYSRTSLAHDMERTLLPEGLLLLLHLHNSLTYNLGAGYALTPEAWASLFVGSQLDIKIMPERRIVEDFLLHNKLDLVGNCAQDELNSSNAIVILATSDKSLFKAYDGVDSDFLSVKSNLVINPLYEIEEKEDKILLERSLHKYSLGDSLPLAEKYFPQKCEISNDLIRGRQLCISDSKKVEDLMKKFIIINVPENYM